MLRLFVKIMGKIAFTCLLFFVFILNSFGQFKTTQEQVLEQQNNINEDYEFISEAFINPSKFVKVIGSKTNSVQIIREKDKKKFKKDYEDGKGVENFINWGLSLSIPEIKKAIPKITDDLIHDFNKKNKKFYLWQNKFDHSDKYVLISKEQKSDIFNEARKSFYSWKLFRETYPNSNGVLYHFSRVGFSKDKKTALIYVTFSCGSLCASGDYFFYVKENGKWVEKNKINKWVS